MVDYKKKYLKYKKKYLAITKLKGGVNSKEKRSLHMINLLQELIDPSPRTVSIPPHHHTLEKKSENGFNNIKDCQKEEIEGEELTPSTKK